jgi:hypothetical protein
VSPFAYFKLKLQKVLTTGSTIFWIAAPFVIAGGLCARIFWELARLGWKLPDWTWAGIKHLFA